MESLKLKIGKIARFKTIKWFCKIIFIKLDSKNY